jgi:hypothetical protein
VKKKLAVVLLTGLCAAGLVANALAQVGTEQTLWNRLRDSNYAQHGYPNGQNQFPLFQSPSETDKLARQLAQAKGDGERESLKAKLAQELEKQFDQRQKKHQAESEDLEAQVKKLKELIRTRNENRKEIISRRVEFLKIKVQAEPNAAKQSGDRRRIGQ